MNLPPTKRPVVISPPGSFRFLQTAPHKKKKMKTKNPADALVNGTGSITVLSLNTHWVARCPVRLPDPLVHAQLRRLLRRRGGEVPALFGFQARITPAGPSAEIRVFSGQREMFTCGVAWAENDWAAELWRSLLSRSWAMCPSEEPRWVPAPALPWMVTLYSRCFERLPLADGVALAVFQRSLASVLLCRHLPQWEAAKLFSSTSTGEIEGARNSSDDRKAQCGDAVVQSITA
jgi:hypothetical protein